MKKFSTPTALYIIGLIILAATNIFVLSGVASNRSGMPTTLVTLTERELALPYRYHEENSGVSLRMDWRALGKDKTGNQWSYYNSPAWLDTEKLRSLGFDVDRYLDSGSDSALEQEPLSKDVLLVLEHDGDAYKESLRRVAARLERQKHLHFSNKTDKSLSDQYQNALKHLEKVKTSETRLYAVDAGLDMQILRKTYPDKNKYIIAQGIVDPSFRNRNKQEASGTIRRLSIDRIQVPLAHRKILVELMEKQEFNRDKVKPPRYQVKVAYGSRLEPWIISVEKMDSDTHQ